MSSTVQPPKKQIEDDNSIYLAKLAWVLKTKHEKCPPQCLTLNRLSKSISFVRLKVSPDMTCGYCYIQSHWKWKKKPSKHFSPTPSQDSDLKTFMWDLRSGPSPLLDCWTVVLVLFSPPPPQLWSTVTFAGTKQPGDEASL